MYEIFYEVFNKVYGISHNNIAECLDMKQVSTHYLPSFHRCITVSKNPIVIFSLRGAFDTEYLGFSSNDKDVVEKELTEILKKETKKPDSVFGTLKRIYDIIKKAKFNVNFINYLYEHDIEFVAGEINVSSDLYRDFNTKFEEKFRFIIENIECFISKCSNVYIAVEKCEKVVYRNKVYICYRRVNPTIYSIEDKCEIIDQQLKDNIIAKLKLIGEV